MEQAQDKEKEGDVARERMQRNYSPLPLTGPLTVGALLDRAFRLYRSRFGLFLLTGAVLIAPIAIVSGIFLARFFANYMQTLDMLMREPPPEFGPFAFFSALSGDFAGVTLIGLFLAAAGAIGLMMSLSTISSSLISVIGLPFFAAAAVLLYYDLRIRGSGYALKP